MTTPLLLALLGAAVTQAVPQAPPQQPASPPPSAQAPGPRVGVDAPALPVTLDDVIRRALENNADVAIARIDTRISAENILAAKGAYDPRLLPLVSFQRAVNASASALGGAVDGRVETNQAVLSAGIVGLTPWAGGSFSVDFTETRNSTSNQFAKLNPQFPATFGFSYTQPLWRDRAIDAERRAILLSQRADDLTHAQLTQSLMDQLMLVEQAYWELVFTVRNLDVQNVALGQAREQVASNERQAQAGTLAPIDVIEAATQVENFRQTVALSQQALTEAENRLKQLMLTNRTAPEWKQPVVPLNPVDRDAPPLGVDDAIALALKRRPELAASDTARAQNEIDRRFYEDQKRPQVDLVGGATLAGLSGGRVTSTDATIPSFLIGTYGTSLGNLFASRFPTAVIQLQMDVPLRNTGARANVARTELTAARLVREREQLEQAIEAEVRNALQAVQSTRDRLDAAASASRNALEQYNSERRRFDSGLGTVFLVLQRQSALVAAQAREARARADLNQAVALLDRAVGGTLERYGVTVR
jgi:HAE1 family hydrophobic/amphiphilic exporter-1